MDREGNIYVATGNGRFTLPSGRDYGDSLLKLSLNGHDLSVSDYFTPFNERELNADDADFGSGGPMLLPDTHLLLIGAKDHGLYLLDRDRLGKYQSGDNSHALQVIRLRGGIYAAPAYWNKHVFVLASGDYLSDFALNGGRLSSVPVAMSNQKFGNPGATPAISANGTRNGIVWLIETKAWNYYSDKNAVLHAYDASNIAHELYNSVAGPALRFTVPTVANGRVYVETKGAVDVFGLLH